MSYDIDANGVVVPKDPVALAQARLDAATAGRIWWREDGGKSLVPLYENELALLQNVAPGLDPLKPATEKRHNAQ